MIPEIEQKLKCNIYVLDIDKIPILGRTQNMYDMLLYKSEYIEDQQQYYLLFNDSHYDTITNIKGFLAIEYYCNKCLSCYKNKSSYENHDCKVTHITDKKKKKLGHANSLEMKGII